MPRGVTVVHVACAALLPFVAQSALGSGTELTPAETIDLLKKYQSESRCSVDCEYTALPELREKRPIPQLLELYANRKILWLGGSGWGQVCSAVGSTECVPSLLDGLRDPSPWWRAFACRAIEFLSTEEAIPILVGLLRDEEILNEPPESGVARIVGEPSVALYAASALAAMGREDGVEHLLAHAEYIRTFRSERQFRFHLPLPYIGHFRTLSGQDFGDDLEAWRSWFQENE